MVDQLAGELAAATTKRYKIDADTAHQLIRELWLSEPLLWDQAAQLRDADALRRTRGYKQAVARAKTAIYYHLRRYNQDDAKFEAGRATLQTLSGTSGATGSDDVERARSDILEAHVSTRERLDSQAEFYRVLFDLVGAPRSVLDIGSGVHPMMFPFSTLGASVDRYVAIDRDVKAIDAVNAWASYLPTGRLSGHVWRLEDGFDDLVVAGSPRKFDLGLALKFVPVIVRQERLSLSVLADAPVDRLLVTGAREAMVKRQTISKREEHVLRGFARDHGFSVVGEFSTPSEVGLLLERS